MPVFHIAGCHVSVTVARDCHTVHHALICSLHHWVSWGSVGSSLEDKFRLNYRPETVRYILTRKAVLCAVQAHFIVDRRLMINLLSMSWQILRVRGVSALSIIHDLFKKASIWLVLVDLAVAVAVQQYRHLDSFKASWRQYFFARPTRHDSERSWLLRLLELRLTNFPTYLLTYLLTYLQQCQCESTLQQSIQNLSHKSSQALVVIR